MTVRELLARIDSAEITQWQKFAELEPFGRERENAAIIAATIANVFREESASVIEPHQIIPEVPAPEPVVRSSVELAAKLERMKDNYIAAKRRG